MIVREQVAVRLARERERQVRAHLDREGHDRRLGRLVDRRPNGDAPARLPLDGELDPVLLEDAPELRPGADGQRDRGRRRPDRRRPGRCPARRGAAAASGAAHGPRALRRAGPRPTRASRWARSRSRATAGRPRAGRSGNACSARGSIGRPPRRISARSRRSSTAAGRKGGRRPRTVDEAPRAGRDARAAPGRRARSGRAAPSARRGRRPTPACSGGSPRARTGATTSARPSRSSRARGAPPRPGR